MDKYIVKWKNNEKEFDEGMDALKFAEEKGETDGVNTYVYRETDGVRGEEPFFACTWEI